MIVLLNLHGLAHAILMEHYSSILVHLEKPPLHDLPNFLAYCEFFTTALTVHHESEGEFPIFPM